jgi:hypothetical protein
MEAPENNLFLRLRKWASGQDENFCTESLVFVLRRLLDHQPDVGVRLLELLTDKLLHVPSGEAAKVRIRTQVGTAKGRPDIVIGWADQEIVIEVKVESEPQPGQLVGYKDIGTGLVLLTRYKPTIPEGENAPDHMVRWHQVAASLDEQVRLGVDLEPVTRYICEQFIEFLGARGMAIEKASWHMTEGLRAWGNFLKMLYEAASACEVSATMKGAVGLEYIGVKVDGGKYWVGIEYAYPGTLSFGTCSQIDPDAAANLGVGQLTEASWVPGRHRWFRFLELDSESVYFFARSKVSQMEYLEGFLRECLAQARSIETSDQPLTPEEPQGD